MSSSMAWGEGLDPWGLVPWLWRTLGFPPERSPEWGVAVKLLLCPGPHPGYFHSHLQPLWRTWMGSCGWAFIPSAHQERRMGFVQQLSWPGMWGTLRMGGLLCPPRYQSPLPCQSLPPVQKPHNPHGKNIICYFNKAITKWFIYFLMHYLLLGFMSNFSLSGLKRFVFLVDAVKLHFVPALLCGLPICH